MLYARIFFLFLSIATFSCSALGALLKHDEKVGKDLVRLEWDDRKTNTTACPSINGTVFSFSGNDGKSHDSDKTNLDILEGKLANGCIRLIRVSINPDSPDSPDSPDDPGGYWLNHSSYSTAAMLMVEVIYKAENRWRDATGNYYANGKTIVVGISAGATIAAAALENSLVAVGPSYPMNFDRTIMLSGPFGADVSKECSIIENQAIKEMLDKYFRTNNACVNPNTPYGKVDETKDVVVLSNKSFRPYLRPGNEIAIFVGKNDRMGSSNISIGGGIGWQPVPAVERYIKSIGGGVDSFFTRVSEHSENQQNMYDYMLYEVEGEHELWKSQYVREQVCKHAFDEVNELLGTAHKLSLTDCE
jgi:hypothetical protein